MISLQINHVTRTWISFNETKVLSKKHDLVLGAKLSYIKMTLFNINPFRFSFSFRLKTCHNDTLQLRWLCVEIVFKYDNFMPKLCV